MEHNEWKPTHGTGEVECLTPSIPISKLQTHALVKISPSTKGAIFMVPRPKLGGNSIYTLHHGPPKAKVYTPKCEDNLLQARAPTPPINTPPPFLQKITKNKIKKKYENSLSLSLSPFVSFSLALVFFLFPYKTALKFQSFLLYLYLHEALGE